MTLIELMISMLILTLVCTAWLEIIGIQSAKKEAYRREAVERLAGMMDAFIDFNKTNNIDRIKAKSYIVQIGLNDFSITDSSSETSINQVFSNDEPPIGYRLRVVGSSSNKINGWNKKWLIGELYNKTGTLMPSDKPFFSLPICLW